MDREIYELIKTNTELMKLITELMYQNNYLLQKNYLTNKENEDCQQYERKD